MSLKNYEKEIKLVVENTNFDIGDIFVPIEDSPNFDEILKAYEFYRETLTNNSARFNLQQSFIFYLNNTTVNAKAGTQGEFDIICINSGLIIYLIQNIREKEEFEKILKDDYKRIHNSLDNPINILMYQVALHYSFYHELGHLVQKSEELNNFINEQPNEDAPFDLKNHKLEFDADSFSALSIAAHIHQYVFKIFGETLDTDQIESTIELFCTSIILYFLSFESNKKEIYYEENSHPHPVIRILNVILTITNYFRNSPRIIDKGIKINHLKIYDLTIRNVMKIEEEIFKSDKAKKFSEVLGTQKNEIKNYIGKLLNYKPENFTSGIDRWNETLPK